MHFLVVLLRVLLEWLGFERGDGLRLAARADGRIEHMPTRPGLWERWLNWLGRTACGSSRPEEKVRAGRGAARWRRPAAE